jgi:hypothetical protein
MARGEVTITLPDGEETRLLYTNRALGEAEQTMGKPILGILDGLSKNQAGISEIAGLLRAGMEAARRDEKRGGKPPTVNDAYDLMDAIGFAEAVKAVAEGVTAVLTVESPN